MVMINMNPGEDVGIWHVAGEGADSRVRVPVMPPLVPTPAEIIQWIEERGCCVKKFPEWVWGRNIHEYVLKNAEGFAEDLSKWLERRLSDADNENG
jgi:hypothetical protein